MFRPPLSNPAQKRTLRPLYATHQATPWGGFLDPDWAQTFDILPGTVMARSYGEVFTPFTGATGQVPFGLSALFVAPTLGVTEVTGDGTNLFTVWVGDSQAVFEVLAPAFDTTGALTTWNPNADYNVSFLAVSGTTVYAGGWFGRFMVRINR